MLLSIEKCLPKFYFALFITFILFAADVSAQTKKKQISPQKPASSVRADAKNQAGKTPPKPKDEKPVNGKKIDSGKTKPADLKKQAEENKQAQIESAKKRAAEEERRRAAQAEARRRAEAAREAQARRIAFERGLRTETIENILNDNTEGEDLEVRRAAINALGNHAGTVVVLEPQTGKILTIINQDWAIRKGFKPCSTIKLVTGVAGLNENLINADGNVRSRSFPLNLDDALAHSNNVYFQNVGAGLGNPKMLTYAQMLGLGQPTGINAENETAGRLPIGNSNARIYSHGDDFEVTPLQLGVMVSAISNGGKVVVPHIPRTKFEKANFRGAMRYQVNLPKYALRGVIPGMVGASVYGTARRGVDSTLAIAGKTGSCIGQGSWVGLFASVAPIENPKFAVIVITRGEAERGRHAAAIAGKIYQTLKPRIIESDNRNLAKIPLELKPQPKINEKISARIDSEEGVESEDNDVPKVSERQIGKKETDPKTEVKSAENQAEMFPTVVIKVKNQEDGVTRPRIVRQK